MVRWFAGLGLLVSLLAVAPLHAQDCTTLADNDPCEDGLFCTVGDHCEGGVCVPGPARDCSASGDQCNDGVCNEGTDACEAQPKAGTPTCDDGLFCTVGDLCESGACVPGSARDCSGASDQCNDGVCNETTDTCEPQPKAGTPTCDDGLFCTDGDRCVAGTCTATGPHDCSASGNQCNDGVCNETTNACVAQPKAGTPACDDGNGCTQTDT
jgi:hypothetical protein